MSYLQRTYREAAPAMQQFHDLVRAAWADPAIVAGVNCHTGSAALFDTFIAKPGNEARLRALLVAAAAQAAHPTSRALVERTLAAFDRFAAGLARLYLPLVPAAAAAWPLPPDAPAWGQALTLGELRQVSTWDDFQHAPAKRPTTVAVLRDATHLYVRVQAGAAAARDRVEMVLEASRHATKFYVAVDRAGQRYGMKNRVPWASAEWQAAVTDAPPDETLHDFEVR